MTEQKNGRVFILGVDEAGPEGFDSYVLVDARRNRVVWSSVFIAGSEPQFPLWLCLRMWLGLVTVAKETVALPDYMKIPESPVGYWHSKETGWTVHKRTRELIVHREDRIE